MHAIFHGDTTQILDGLVADASVDLVFADPPYNIGKRFGNVVDRWPSDEDYAAWCFGWLDSCVRKLKPTGSMYLMASTQAMPVLDLFMRSRLTVLSRIVWHYDSSGVQAKKHFGSLYEPILFCVKDPAHYTFDADAVRIPAKTGAVRGLFDHRKGAPYNTTKVPGNVWYFPRVRYKMPEYVPHPTQKPEALLERILLASTQVGDLVLDPFAGSFTTAAVAQRLGRHSLNFELNEAYCVAGTKRLGCPQSHPGRPGRV